MEISGTIRTPGPKADFQYWSSTWGTTISYPNPIFFLPRTFTRRKFWFDVKSNSFADDAWGLRWVFVNSARIGPNGGRTEFVYDYNNDFKTKQPVMREGAHREFPFNTGTLLGMSMQQEPIQSRARTGGGGPFQGRSVPNFLLGEFDYLMLEPTRQGQAPWTPSIGTNIAQIFCAVYSEEPIDTR